MGATAYIAATAGQLPLAQQINQFLTVHPSVELYAGTLRSTQTTPGSTHLSGSATQYMAQSFTTGSSQTAIGYISAPIGSFTSSGSTLGTTTLSLYANSAGAPTGSPLVSTTFTTEYVYLASGNVNTAFVLYPLPITGLTVSTEYWLVVAPAGNGTNHYTWYESNQTSGASISNNGTSWTAQAFGLEYSVYDRTATGMPTCTWDDSGAQWTATTYTTSGQVQTYAEYVVGQTATGYSQSFRTFTYSNGLLTKVS